MYRAILEANHNCTAMNRDRQYSLHMAALHRIKNKPSALDAGSLQQRRPYTLRGKAQKEEKERITTENQKIVKALLKQLPSYDRAVDFEHKVDHDKQMSRISTTKTAQWGFACKQDGNAKSASGASRLPPIEWK